MSRIDKIWPIGGSFRAFLAQDVLAANVEVLIPVFLDNTGKVVFGSAPPGGRYKGVICPTRVMLVSQGEPIDVMMRGEIVEFPSITSPAPAGTDIFANILTPFAIDATGAGTTGANPVGFTVESKAARGARLIVNFGVGAVHV